MILLSNGCSAVKHAYVIIIAMLEEQCASKIIQFLFTISLVIETTLQRFERKARL